MRGLRTVLGIVVFALAVTPTYAQQPPGPKDPHHPETPTAAAPASPSVPPGTAPASAMMPMEMCRQMMMGEHMMGGMGMPMGGAAQNMDPKMRAEMLEMRGEMMKAMGEIMLKHAKRMQGPSR